MKVNVINVLRNSFTDSKGNEVKYCKFACLVPYEENDNKYGYEITYFTTKYDNYDLIRSYVKDNKSVMLEVAYSKQANGLYKVKPVRIGETDL